MRINISTYQECPFRSPSLCIHLPNTNTRAHSHVSINRLHHLSSSFIYQTFSLPPRDHLISSLLYAQPSQRAHTRLARKDNRPFFGQHDFGLLSILRSGVWTRRTFETCLFIYWPEVPYFNAADRGFRRRVFPVKVSCVRPCPSQPKDRLPTKRLLCLVFPFIWFLYIHCIVANLFSYFWNNSFYLYIYIY